MLAKCVCVPLWRGTARLFMCTRWAPPVDLRRGLVQRPLRVLGRTALRHARPRRTGAIGVRQERPECSGGESAVTRIGTRGLVARTKGHIVLDVVRNDAPSNGQTMRMPIPIVRKRARQCKRTLETPWVHFAPETRMCVLWLPLGQQHVACRVASWWDIGRRRPLAANSMPPHMPVPSIFRCLVWACPATRCDVRSAARRKEAGRQRHAPGFSRQARQTGGAGVHHHGVQAATALCTTPLPPGFLNIPSLPSRPPADRPRPPSFPPGPCVGARCIAYVRKRKCENGNGHCRTMVSGGGEEPAPQ